MAAPMMHSMDFHAAMVSPQDKYRSIAPGQTISFEFTPNYPGVFMYHCGTPMVLEHIASGMYGMMIVEPRDGYPTKVDREYAVDPERVLHQARSARSARSTASRCTCSTATGCAPRRPTYTVFNGRYNGMVDKPLPAKPGERVRLFVLNVGPSNTSSFHVVGTIFDRVWIDGNPDNQLRGMQTVLLGSTNGAIVEFIIPEAGSYVMVDHHFANASQGAIGLIAAGGTPASAGEQRASQHSRRPRRRPIPTAVKGKLAFESQVPRLPLDRRRRQARPGPLRRDEAPRRQLARALAEVAGADAASPTPIAKAMLDKYKLPMPNQNLSRRGDHASTSRTSSGPTRTCDRRASDAAAAGCAGHRAAAEQDAIRLAGCRAGA